MFRSEIRYRCFWLALILLSTLSAYSNGPENGEKLIGKQLQVFEDPSGEFTIENIASQQFLPISVDVPNLGLKNSTFWLKLNVSEENGSILEFPNNEIDRIEAYFMSKEGIVRTETHGLLVDNGGEKALDYCFAFEQASNINHIYFKIQSDKPLLLPIYARTAEAHSRVTLSRSLIFGTYIGMMFFLLLYNIFIFFSTNDKSYLRYVVYIALVTITQLTFHGFGKMYFWPWSTWLSANATSIFTLLTAIAANEFMISFIGAKKTLPKLTLISRCIYVFMALGLVLRITSFPLFAYEALRAIIGAFAFFQLAIAIIMLSKGKREAGFFLIAWSLFLFGVVLFVLKDASILPLNLFTENTMIFGSAFEGILLSFGLADRIKTLRQEKRRSQEEALRISRENERIIREQNEILEEKVTLRTADLEKSNTDLKEAQSQLVDAEKMASLGQLTAGIAHEINNPINFISASIPPLKRDLSEILEIFNLQSQYLHAQSDEAAKGIIAKAKELDLEYTLNEVGTIVKSIEEGANRTTEIVRGLRNFSRHDEGDMKEVSIEEGLKSTITLLNPDLKRKAEITTELNGDMPILCFPGKLNQVFMNLMSNGLQAIHSKFNGQPGGKLLIRTFLDNDSYVIEIKDNGMGMSPETKKRVFEPFFTTKDVGEGTGLGLSIAHGIIETHNGSIELLSEPGVGTNFIIRIPTAEEHKHRA